MRKNKNEKQLRNIKNVINEQIIVWSLFCFGLKRGYGWEGRGGAGGAELTDLSLVCRYYICFWLCLADKPMSKPIGISWARSQNASHGRACLREKDYCDIFLNIRFDVCLFLFCLLFLYLFTVVYFYLFLIFLFIFSFFICSSNSITN